MASHSLTTFAGRSIWCRSSSGPWHPTHSADGVTAAHLTTAADHPWTCHHSPFRVSRTSHMPSRAGSASASLLAARLPPCAARARHRIRAQQTDGRGRFCKVCSSHGNSRRLAPGAGRAQTSAAARHLPVRSLRNLTGSHLEPGRDSCAHGSNRRARVDQEGRSSPCHRLARLRHGHAC